MKKFEKEIKIKTNGKKKDNGLSKEKNNQRI